MDSREHFVFENTVLKPRFMLEEIRHSINDSTEGEAQN